MKALVLQEGSSFPVYTDAPDLDVTEHEVLVEILAAGMNRRDFYICKGLYPGVRIPVILGSDAVGVIEGQRVVISPGIGWRFNDRFQPSDYSIIGMPQDGTFAEFISVAPEQVFQAPKHLTDHEAACIGLGGLTAFRALFTKAECSIEDKVLITGIGGGVATIAMQFEIGLGCEVWVTTGADWKGEKAIELGAAGYINYRENDWHKELKRVAGLFNVIIDSAGGPGFEGLVNVCAPGARIALYGGTAGKIKSLSPQLIFWRQIAIMGTTMGSDEEFAEMLEFVEKYKIKPLVDKVYDLKSGNDAFQRLGMSEGMGKIVLDISVK
jgi:NADPH:quinone reductase-like Zn-dependent oxidoreductase